MLKLGPSADADYISRNGIIDTVPAGVNGQLRDKVKAAVQATLGMDKGAAPTREEEKPVAGKKPIAPRGGKPKPVAAPGYTEQRSDLFYVYLREMKDASLLTRDDEVELGLRKNGGGPDAELAKNELIKANLRLVVSIARGYLYRGISISDLVQEGNIGLMKAAEKFDHTRGFRFSTYASWWISQTIIRFIEDHVRMIRVPIYKTKIYNKVKRLQKEALQNTGRELSMHELADNLEMNIAELAGLMGLNAEPVSLQAPISHDSDTTVGEMLSDPDAEDPSSCLDERELMQLAERFMSRAKLTPQELRVMELRYGLNGEEALSLEDIGHILGLPRETVRKMEIKVLRRMRAHRNTLAPEQTI